MKILGIDFGEKKIGLAISEGVLAEPFGIVSITNYRLPITKLCQREKIEQIVVGLPEGRLAAKVKKFASQLAKLTDLPLEFQDETLTTQEAIAKMKEVGKRVKNEDAVSAALILQAYLEKRSV